MKIESYNNNQYLQTENTDENVKDKFTDKSKKSEKKNMLTTNVNNNDKLEISNDSMKIKSINGKIDSGYYNNPSILREVAHKIINSIDEQI
jgi:hypothetical protein